MRQNRSESWNVWRNASLVAAGLIGVEMVVKAATRTAYSFKDKSVLITGGSRGLGLEMARILAREGAWLSLIARNRTALENAREELQRMGARVITLSCDIRDRRQVEEAIRSTVQHYGRIDVLINNAGIIQVGPFEQMTLDDYQNAMATHFWGPVYATLAVVPLMRQQGAGRIVNISSIGGKLGVPHLLPYVSSKFAQAGFSEALTAEIAKYNIAVTSVFPGLMRTGSHVNASFKGKNELEFAWFSVAAGFPVVSINAQRAARQIVEACRSGKQELVITPTARLANLAKAALPGLVALGTHLVASLLPASGTESPRAARSGWNSRTRWSPSPLTKLADNAIDRNNERIPKELDDLPLRA